MLFAIIKSFSKHNNMKKVSTALRTWFVIHFIVDMIFGIPLLFAPEWVLGLFGISIISTLTARLVGASLIAIGGMSFVARDESEDVYRTLLNFKVFWSVGAMVAILLYIFEGGNPSTWVIFAVFLIFNVVWTCYRIKLNRLA